MFYLKKLSIMLMDFFLCIVDKLSPADLSLQH